MSTITRFTVLLAVGLLPAAASLAQTSLAPEPDHVRPRVLLPPAAILPGAARATAAPSRTVEPADAQAFVAGVESEMAQIDEYVARSAFVKNTYITFDTDWLESRANAEQSRAMLGFIKGAARYGSAAVDDATRRKLEIIKLATALPPPDREEALQELATVTTRLDSARSTLAVPYRGRTLTIEAAAELMRGLRNPAELKLLWEAIRTNLPPMRDDYARSVALANEGARGLGYKDVGEMWRSSYDMPPEAFAALVDRLWVQVEPLYRAYLCFLRARLSEQYGAAAQPRTGPIRADFSGVDWDDLAPIVVPKTEAPFDLTQLLVQKNVSVLDMARTAERFYISLGQPALPQTFWERSMFTRPRDREVGCWPATWTLDNKDDVRLQACLTVKARDFYMIHHELGHAVYYRAYQQQPHLFKGGANDGFHEAVGDFIALSAQTPTYLRQIGLLERLPGAETDIPFLLAMVDRHAMVFANNLAMEKWRWGVFSGAIAPEQYNDAWWRTLLQYRGVAPPGPRPPDGFDPGIVWHVASYTPVIRYSLAEIYQFQFHRAACRMAGWTGPLHRCSIYGNREVGARFEAMLKLGLSKPWPEALAAFTGERELDASAMVEYFAPLKAWLDEKNKGEVCTW